MKPSPQQRLVLLSLADEPARLMLGRYYRLLDGIGHKIPTGTAASLLRRGWAALLSGTTETHTTEGNGKPPMWLVITPAGVEAVREYL